ncbi:NAD-dependent epimerase/dehydratase family protein [Nocardia sp. IFM 10818]
MVVIPDRVVILGASGFVGSAVLRELAAHRLSIRAVSRKPVPVPARAVAEIEVLPLDLTEPGAMRTAIAEADVVVHAVAHIAGASSWRVDRGDAEAERVNVGLVRDLIEAAAARPAADRLLRVVFAATTTQVGRADREILDGSEPDRPTGGYDRQKLEAERLLLAATDDGVLAATSLRLPTVFGHAPHAPDMVRGVVAVMARRALSEQPLTMWHDGSVRRDLVHVDDVARALVAACRHIGELCGRAWLIGSGIGMPLGEVFRRTADLAAEYTGVTVPVVSVPPPDYAEPGDFRSVTVDSSAFREITGWSPAVRLDEALRSTVAFFAEAMKIPAQQQLPTIDRGNMCRICGGTVQEFMDFGRQPLSDAFPAPGETAGEFFYHLRVGVCESCAMVQQLDEVPRERMFDDAYPYRSAGSARMREHFARTAREFLATELTGPDPFIVEIGSNDGTMLGTVKDAGVRHLGVEPCGGVADIARQGGIRVRSSFFEESAGIDIAAQDGPADVIYAANTICHIPYLDSIFRGIDALLAPNGVFVFEDPYLGDIVEKVSFDQIYDEHFYLFSARSVAAMAERFGFELVDVARLPVHGGEVRYTIARAGARQRSTAVGELIAAEDARGLAELPTLRKFAAEVDQICHDLVRTLTELRDSGVKVAGYGATAKSATVTNYAGIGPDLVACVFDTTVAKIGRLMPGSHIPVVPAAGFAEYDGDYVLLFAWNHAEEILAKEREFARRGGRWLVYVPEVRTL